MSNTIITVINVLLIESAVFTLCFINNSRRILSFMVLLLSTHLLFAYFGAEFFGILLLLLFLPIVFVMFMLGNMTRIRKEKYIETRTAVAASLLSGVFAVTVSILYPYGDKKNADGTVITAPDFLAGLYKEHMDLVIVTAVLAFITILATTVVFYDEKKRDRQ